MVVHRIRQLKFLFLTVELQTTRRFLLLRYLRLLSDNAVPDPVFQDLTDHGQLAVDRRPLIVLHSEMDNEVLNVERRDVRQFLLVAKVIDDLFHPVLSNPSRFLL